MNIGIVTAWLERGAAYVSRAYAETFSKEHKVFIYARGGEYYAKGDPNWDMDYVTWGKIVKGKGGFYIDSKDFFDWVEKCNLDLILFNEQRHWDIILKCQKLKIPIGSYVDFYTKKTVKYFDAFDFLFCNTKKHFSVFNNHKQSYYIPWGTDIDLFLPSRNQDFSKAIFFHSAGMGKGNIRKGTDLVIKSFQNITGNAKLIIHSQVGIENFPDIAEIVHNDPRISFIHKTVHAPGLYSLGNVYVYPTRLEGIGLTIAEALSCGLPVITTDNSPMNEFVITGYNGRLVKVSKYENRNDNYYWPQSICDIDDLTEAMQAYANNPTLIREQSENARNYAKKNLDWKKNSESLLSIIPNIKIKRSKSPILYCSIMWFSFVNTKLKPYIKKMKRNIVLFIRHKQHK